MLTKEEVSDLRSHFDRVVVTKLELQLAEIRAKEALQVLENFLWNLEHKKA